MSSKVHSQAAAQDPTQAAQFARYLFQVEEAERQRIAAQLNDNTLQEMAKVHSQLEKIQAGKKPEAQRKIAAEAARTLDTAMQTVRDIVGRLSPKDLQKLGFIASVRKEARVLAREHKLKVLIKIQENFPCLAPLLELALFRIVQEALHNIGKHANARNAEIELRKETGKIRLLIQDDGAGFRRKPIFQPQFPGIFAMRERVRCLNGTLRIRTRPGRGTRIEVFVNQPSDAGGGSPGAAMSHSTATARRSARLEIVAREKNGELPTEERAS